MNTVKITDRKNTKIIAHRGVSGLEKENSMPAFVAAGNRSYFGIETDVHLTRDGKFIIIHDENPERVSGVSLCVEQTDYEQLRSIKLYDTDGATLRCDLSLPSLEEYINVCKRYEKTAVLELKNAMPKTALADMCEVIKGLDYLDKVIFISFSFENMVFIKELYPQQTVQFLTCEYSERLFEDLKRYGMDLDIHHAAVDNTLIEMCRQNGIKLNCWTVDSLERAQELIDMGVDFITSNILE